jgi:hypothetical protein
MGEIAAILNSQRSPDERSHIRAFVFGARRAERAWALHCLNRRNGQLKLNPGLLTTGRLVNVRRTTTFFVSSTSKGLEEYRAWTRTYIDKIGGRYLGMENNIAADVPRLQQCKKEIEDSDVVIAIVGSSYGTIPAGKARSFTDLELRHAMECRKTILPFFLDAKLMTLEGETLNNAIRLLKLRKKIEAYSGPATFSNLNTFMPSLDASITAWKHPGPVVSSKDSRPEGAPGLTKPHRRKPAFASSHRSPTGSK